MNKVAFHPDGRRLAVAGSEVVEIWDLETARKLHDLRGHKKWVYCLAYSPDGKWLATGGWDNTVKLRDAATGVEALTIFAHDGFVLSLAFSPDSRSLVTSSEDRSTRLWEVPSGRRLATFHGHTDFVQAVAFRPDGREVGTGSADGSIRFWDLRTSRPVVVGHTGCGAVASPSGATDFGSSRRQELMGQTPCPRRAGTPSPANSTLRWRGSSSKPCPRTSCRAPETRRSVTSPDGKLIAQVSASAVHRRPRGARSIP